MNLQNPQIDIVKRKAFLAAWNDRFPQVHGGGFAGMVVFRGDEVLLERNGLRWLSLHLNPATFDSALGQRIGAPSEVLISGDWVECFGLLNGDCLEVERVVLLSPNRRDQGHQSGVNPAVRQWESFLKEVREFFVVEGFDELRTPTLVPCPGTEPFLDPFKTEFIYGSKSETLFLPTSPELHLKKCLAMGWERIFEIKPCFRNSELSPHHQPEFYMVEWYRAFSTMSEIQSDVSELVLRLSPAMQKCQWHVLSVADLFERHLQFRLTPQTSKEELIEVAGRHRIDVSRAVDFDEVFFFLFLEKIEPELKNYDCLFLHSYPPSQAALARLTSEGWGDRFEFYIRGLEIANAFNELNDPKVQRVRSQEDLDKKAHHGRMPIGLDEEFFQYLEGGMPPSCGIALGLERLFMALHGYKSIEEFRLFVKK